MSQDIFCDARYCLRRHIGVFQNIGLTIYISDSEDIIQRIVFTNPQVIRNVFGCENQSEMQKLGIRMTLRCPRKALKFTLLQLHLPLIRTLGKHEASQSLLPVNISFLYKHIVSLFHSHPGTVVLLTDCDFVR